MINYFNGIHDQEVWLHIPVNGDVHYYLFH